MFLLKTLQELPWIAGSVIVVTTFVLFTIAGLLITRKFSNTKNLKAHHDVAGFIFANLGVLYSVLIGFTAVNVQSRYDHTREIAQQEASCLEELYRDAGIFSDKDTQSIRKGIIAYGESIVKKEWVTMSSGRPNPDTSIKLNALWDIYYNISITTPKEELWYKVAIEKLNNLIKFRLSRLLGGQESLSSEMWTFLILDGIALIAFMWFFGPESLFLHTFMASIFAASTAFLLFLIYTLDTAFVGQASIPPEALNRILELFPSFS